ncbi:MAG: TetR/AcrR family transcriptional regulator [Parvibaculum sp.]|nr:TetR/AcrR family transcriptional regulator [Parvibaculum sp.]
MKKPTAGSERPKRGAPEETRRRLVAAAAEEFNIRGLHGTTADLIAARAGYATGTFYKHFRDKNEVLVAAYEAWVSEEWNAIGREVLGGGEPEAMARRIVALGAELHIRWGGLRRAMFMLVADDAAAQKSYRALQRRQLKIVESLRKQRGEGGGCSREADALVLMTMERAFDAIAQGELRELNLGRTAILERVTALLADALSPDA